MAQMVCPHCGHEEYNESKIEKVDVHNPDDPIYEADGYICSSKYCEESFEEPIEDYEFNEAAKEAKLEAEADEYRDMGL